MIRNKKRTSFAQLIQKVSFAKVTIDIVAQKLTQVKKKAVVAGVALLSIVTVQANTLDAEPTDICKTIQDSTVQEQCIDAISEFQDYIEVGGK